MLLRGRGQCNAELILLFVTLKWFILINRLFLLWGTLIIPLSYPYPPDLIGQYVFESHHQEMNEGARRIKGSPSRNIKGAVFE